MASRKQHGFSMLEMLISVSIALVLAAVADVSLQPVLKAQRVNDAYNTTLMALRRARDSAAADMRVYVVTFGPPVLGPNPNGGTISVNETTAGGTLLFSAVLPPDVTYHLEPGIPNSPTVAPTTPDGFGTAANIFDFDQPPGGIGGGNVIYFQPDGSAQDALGNVNNGVVYLGVPGQLPTCRAITLWGYTGRMRGWQLYQIAGQWTWRQQ
jgi:prepilin-type N-terminal cleavage/methylation domain-containing protein